MEQITKLDKFIVPFGGREIELQQVDYATGGMSLLRIRIREHKRFTIFELDPDSAEHWGDAMVAWARQQKALSA